MSFRELNQSDSSTEGDDEDDKSEGKVKLKGRVIVGGKGVAQVLWSSPDDNDK
jgi:hypothetical protein